MRILVTGGSGYLGTALLPLLKEHEVRILDINPPVLSAHDMEYKFFRGSLTDKKEVKDASKGVETVIHLAGIAGVDRCEQNPKLSEKINVEGTENLIREGKDIKKFVFISSSAVYGKMEGHIDEEKQPNPMNTYGRHKLLAEKAVRNADIDYIILRPSNLYGASPLIPKKYAIHNMIANALETGVITVSYGNLMRNFVHVKDCSKAISFLIKTKIENDIFNIGDFDIRLFDAAEMIRKEIEAILGESIKVKVKSWEEKNPLEYSWKKLADVGFSPSLDVKEGIRDIINKMI